MSPVSVKRLAAIMSLGEASVDEVVAITGENRRTVQQWMVASERSGALTRIREGVYRASGIKETRKRPVRRGRLVRCSVTYGRALALRDLGVFTTKDAALLFKMPEASVRVWLCYHVKRGLLARVRRGAFRLADGVQPDDVRPTGVKGRSVLRERPPSYAFGVFYHEVTCPCGAVFWTSNGQLSCSKACAGRKRRVAFDASSLPFDEYDTIRRKRYRQTPRALSACRRRNGAAAFKAYKQQWRASTMYGPDGVDAYMALRALETRLSNMPEGQPLPWLHRAKWRKEEV